MIYKNNSVSLLLGRKYYSNRVCRFAIKRYQFNSNHTLSSKQRNCTISKVKKEIQKNNKYRNPVISTKGRFYNIYFPVIIIVYISDNVTVGGNTNYCNVDIFQNKKWDLSSLRYLDFCNILYFLFWIMQLQNHHSTLTKWITVTYIKNWYPREKRIILYYCGKFKLVV